MEEFCRVILLFFLYSFLGWCCECVYCLLLDGHFVNRGFLNGPLCPVYGFGALLVIYLLRPFSGSLPLLFVCGVLVTSVLEYFTGWLLEMLFHTKWWDYTGHRWNLHGRVCLLNSTLFGILSVIAVRLLYPAGLFLVNTLSFAALIWIASALAHVCLADLYLSVHTVLQLSGKLKALESVLNEAKQRTETAIAEKHLQLALFQSMSMQERVDALLERGEGIRFGERLSASLRSHTLLHRRLLDAFPNMQSGRYAGSLAELKNAIGKMRADLKDKKKQRS